MKKHYFFALVMFIFSSCSQQKATSTAATNFVNQQIEIGTFLDNWHKAAAKADFKNYFNALGSNAYFIGTDAEEMWTKEQFKKYAKPYFDDGEAWEFNPLERTMVASKDGKHIWFHENLDTWMGVCRGSGVISVSPENEYKIEHYVLSLTIPNKELNNVISLLNQEMEIALPEDAKNAY